MKVAFQGVHGAYSDLASRELFGPKTRTLPQSTFDGVFDAVREGHANRGVIPVENSLAGSIHHNYDLLIQNGLHITGEHFLRVEHALLGQPKAHFADIRQVRSHPQALAQCSQFFVDHPKIQAVVWFDTAGAAESLIKETSPEVAALASEYAGKLYGLKAIRSKVQNRSENFTRFLSISRKAEKPNPKQPCKTTITFLPRKNETGVLSRILEIFAQGKIDLSKIESRPDPDKPFNYRFYLDLGGGTGNREILQALNRLKDLVFELRILGSYPRANIPVKKLLPPAVKRKSP